MTNLDENATNTISYLGKQMHGHGQPPQPSVNKADTKVSAKKGDVVYIDGWGDIMGKFVSYDETRRELILEWPKHLKWRFGSFNPRSFYPVQKEEIRVLAASEVFDMMAQLFEFRLEALRKNVVELINHRISSVEI